MSILLFLLKLLGSLLLFLLLTILLLMLVPIGIHSQCTPQGVTLKFKFWLFSFTLLSPDKTKKKQNAKSTESSATSDKKSSQKKKSSPKKKKENAKKVSTAKKSPKKKREKSKDTEKSNVLSQQIALVQSFVPILVATFQALGKHKRIHRLDLELVVGKDDPVEAVELYGYAHALLGTIWIPLDQGLNIENGRARVLLEFEETKPSLYGVFIFTITIGQLLFVLCKLGFGSYKLYKNSQKES